MRRGLASLLLVSLFCSAAQSQTQTAASTLVVAVPGNLFARLGKTGPEGVFLETLDLLLRDMGKTPRYVIMATTDALNDVASGAIDVATVVFPSARLNATMWLSDPLVTESNIVVALKDKGFALESLADLRGKRIGGRLGYRYPLLEKRGDMTLQSYSTDGEMLRSLLFGQTDVTLLSGVSDIFALRSEGIMKRLVILDRAVGTVPLVAAFSKRKFTDAERQAFNRALLEFKRSPQWTQILERNGLADLIEPRPMIPQ